MHSKTARLSSKKRNLAVELHNKRTGVRTANFDIGDYVLKGSLRKDFSAKLSLRLRGPFKVV